MHLPIHFMIHRVYRSAERDFSERDGVPTQRQR